MSSCYDKFKRWLKDWGTFYCSLFTAVIAGIALYYAWGAYDTAKQQLMFQGRWLDVELEAFDYGPGSDGDTQGKFDIAIRNALPWRPENVMLDWKVPPQDRIMDWFTGIFRKKARLLKGNIAEDETWRKRIKSSIAKSPEDVYCKNKEPFELFVFLNWRYQEIPYQSVTKFKFRCIKIKKPSDPNREHPEREYIFGWSKE